MFARVTTPSLVTRRRNKFRATEATATFSPPALLACPAEKEFVPSFPDAAMYVCKPSPRTLPRRRKPQHRVYPSAGTYVLLRVTSTPAHTFFICMRHVIHMHPDKVSPSRGGEHDPKVQGRSAVKIATFYVIRNRGTLSRYLRSTQGFRIVPLRGRGVQRSTRATRKLMYDQRGPRGFISAWETTSFREVRPLHVNGSAEPSAPCRASLRGDAPLRAAAVK